MPDLNAIGDALATRLGSISGLMVTYPWPDVFFPPGLIVQQIGHEPEHTMGSNATHSITRYDFELVLGVNMAQPHRLQQRQLAEYVSPVGTNSVRAALVADRRLGNTVATIYVGEWTREDNEEINTIEHLVQRLPITVWST